MENAMFRRYYESHGPQHMPCPSPEQNAAELAALKELGLPDEDAYRLMALRACGSMATQGSNGGGRYSDFLKVLRARGFDVYS
jgi:hypothetical protein